MALRIILLCLLLAPTLALAQEPAFTINENKEAAFLSTLPVAEPQGAAVCNRRPS